MALTLTSTFCTAITEPEGFAAYDFTTTSIPTEVQVEGYCYTIANIIVFQTQRAGTRYTPPYTGISDAFLAGLLRDCNAIGAAFLARHHMYTSNGDERSMAVMQRLAGLWQAYMGEGSVNVSAGLHALQFGSGGLISQVIESASGSRLLVSPVSQGEVELEDLSTRTQSITFSVGDRD